MTRHLAASRRGAFDTLMDLLFASLLLVIVIVLTIVLFSSLKNDALIKYKTSLGEVRSEEALVGFLRMTVRENATSAPTVVQLITTVKENAASEALLRSIADSYFDDVYEQDPWQLIITYPEGSPVTIKGPAGDSLHSVAHAYLPTANAQVIRIDLLTGSPKPNKIAMPFTG